VQRTIAVNLALVFASPFALADRLRFSGGEEFKSVRVVNVADGEIVFETADARERRPLADLSDVQIDDIPPLEELERQMGAGRHRQAAEGYERLRDRASATWQRRLIEARLLRAYDLEGRLDRAGETYVQLMLDMGSGAAGLAPKNFPSPGSRFYATALGAIERGVVANHLDDATRTALSSYAERLRLAEAGAAGNTPAAPDAATVSPADLPPPSPASQPSALAQAREALDAGRYRQAVQLAEIAMKSASAEERTECSYVSGAAQLALARSRAAKLDAGLTLMEVVSREPGSPLAAAALWRVGTLYEELGRKEKARELYSEARDHPAAPEEVRRAVVDALARTE
jgi:tetratricopeptide (TPR) repeat protein